MRIHCAKKCGKQGRVVTLDTVVMERNNVNIIGLYVLNTQTKTKKNIQQFKKCGWTLNPHVANNLQENTIMHFKTQTESVQAEFEAPYNLMDLPELPDIIRGSTDTHDNDQQLDKQAPVI